MSSLSSAREYAKYWFESGVTSTEVESLIPGSYGELKLFYEEVVHHMQKLEAARVGQYSSDATPKKNVVFDDFQLSPNPITPNDSRINDVIREIMDKVQPGPSQASKPHQNVLFDDFRPSTNPLNQKDSRPSEVIRKITNRPETSTHQGPSQGSNNPGQSNPPHRNVMQGTVDAPPFSPQPGSSTQNDFVQQGPSQASKPHQNVLFDDFRPSTNPLNQKDSRPSDVIRKITNRPETSTHQGPSQGSNNPGQSNPPHRNVMQGTVDAPPFSPQPVPSTQNDSGQIKPYSLKKISERRYAKKVAMETTFKIKFDDTWRGQKLTDLHDALHNMFADVLTEVRSGSADTDLGRVLIHHNALDNAIIVPLQPWAGLTSSKVLEAIQNVLTSHQSLTLDESVHVTVGSVTVPRGGRRTKITNLTGSHDSLTLKKSVVKIVNNDVLCLARAVGVGFVSANITSNSEWRQLVERDPCLSNLKIFEKYRCVSATYYGNIRRANRREQTELAKKLCELANVPADRQGTLNDISAFEDALECKISVVSASLGNKFIRVADNERGDCTHVFLYLVDDSHFHAITNICGFFGQCYFCKDCLKPYSVNNEHSCDTYCIVCKTPDCKVTECTMTCRTCHMECRSQECFLRHKEKPEKRNKNKVPKSECEKYLRCTTCKKVIKIQQRDLDKNPHVCGEFFCSLCENTVVGEHLCYLRPTVPKERDPKYIFFDFECWQSDPFCCTFGYEPHPPCPQCSSEDRCESCRTCTNCGDSCCGRLMHQPNLVVSQTACIDCMKEPCEADSVCDSCGTRCHECIKKDPRTGAYVNTPCEGTCGRRQFVARGPRTLIQFGNWLFSPNHEYYTAISHNGKAYDNVFLLEYLVKNSVRPKKLIFSGTKIMYMVGSHGIRVLDSLNFLNMKLAALPKAFNLQQQNKGTFPHFFNTPQNQRYRGPYPAQNYYGTDYMSHTERAEFIQWHTEKVESGEIFDFRKEILEYCISDVAILREACLKFRALLLEVTNDQIDPFQYVTIASVCMAIYRTLFLKEEYAARFRYDNGDLTDWFPIKKSDSEEMFFFKDQWMTQEAIETTASCVLEGRKFYKTPLAQVPSGGYVQFDHFSKSSIQWLEYLMHRDGQFIRHALNGGEFCIPNTKYRVDGYSSVSNTVWEYHGCIWHGCIFCFKHDRRTTKHPRTNQSMDELYALTLKKKKYLEGQGYRYVCIWEHEFEEQLRSDKEMASFINKLDIQKRLDCREAFYGGRVGASKLWYEAGVDEKIRYVDYCSLYPFTNKYAKYPSGHPTIITDNFKQIHEYFGICKTKILPPRGLYHPVLPYRSGGKLKFPLCRTCADTEQLTPCQHSDEERAILGTWCTPEIQKAVDVGYRILKIYEIYHWEDTAQYDPTTKSGGLFAGYINTFLKYKQEASDFPSWVQTDEDKNKYIRAYFEREGVELNPSNITKNPALRSLAKLALNSFWGKFGERLDVRGNNIFHESEADQFFQMLSDPSKQIMDFHIIGTGHIQVSWTHRKNFLPEDTKTNIFIACFTTCWARLRLYEALELLGNRVCYCDTDSCIYVSKPGYPDVVCGDFLGEFTDEVQGGYITHFVSGGPKNYAFRTNEGKEVCKVRGFSLNYANSKAINFDSIRDLVTQHPLKRKSDEQSHGNKIFITNNKILRSKHRPLIYNRQEKKQYSIVFTKRVLLPNYDTIPFGF